MHQGFQRVTRYYTSITHITQRIKLYKNIYKSYIYIFISLGGLVCCFTILALIPC